MRKGLDERSDESILRWFGYVERERIAKSVYVREYAGSCSVGKSQKRWIDTIKECLKKKRFGCQARQGEWCPILAIDALVGDK